MKTNAWKAKKNLVGTIQLGGRSPTNEAMIENARARDVAEAGDLKIDAAVDQQADAGDRHGGAARREREGIKRVQAADDDIACRAGNGAIRPGFY